MATYRVQKRPRKARSEILWGPRHLDDAASVTCGGAAEVARVRLSKLSTLVRSETALLYG